PINGESPVIGFSRNPQKQAVMRKSQTIAMQERRGFESHQPLRISPLCERVFMLLGLRDERLHNWALAHSFVPRRGPPRMVIADGLPEYPSAASADLAATQGRRVTAPVALSVQLNVSALQDTTRRVTAA